METTLIWLYRDSIRILCGLYMDHGNESGSYCKSRARAMLSDGDTHAAPNWRMGVSNNEGAIEKAGRLLGGQLFWKFDDDWQALNLKNTVLLQVFKYRSRHTSIHDPSLPGRIRRTLI